MFKRISITVAAFGLMLVNAGVSVAYPSESQIDAEARRVCSSWDGTDADLKEEFEAAIFRLVSNGYITVSEMNEQVGYQLGEELGYTMLKYCPKKVIDSVK